MAYSDNISRLARLTAILLKLQSKPFVAVQLLAEQFEVSKRTIYRDLDSLEQAGIPIVLIEGKGYSIMKGYNLPPVAFTEEEANALIFGEKLISKTKDASLIRAFNKATEKIKSVLKDSDKDKIEFLAKRTIIGKNWNNEISSNHLSEIQKALTNFQVLHIRYLKNEADTSSTREVEPFAIYHNTAENWVLIAWCRKRNDFRSFRVDRILSLSTSDQYFAPHKITLEEYTAIQRKKNI